MKIILLTVTIALAGVCTANAQTSLDGSIGTSNQDKVSLNLALRKQFSEKFRAGIELQTSSVRYRFIGAKVIDEGLSTTLSFPFSIRFYEYQKLRLDFYSRVGVRFQGIDKNLATEKVLKDNTSVGLHLEPGLQVSLAFSEKINLQSGVTLPNLFELKPQFIFENNITNIFANVGYQLSQKSILMLKVNAGPAAGASGDSQKFNWSLQAGLRFALNKNQKSLSPQLDPTF
ncbi:hypothetical protein GVN20_21825 [Runella sp. CRIBMP]|uniref:hypothetical protein n=1 Tax=Runella sp. CRIBMP TaxID=2683261 RepID=UPI00141273EA|nr:hypothetical protein [Runella sp. CRIBMP]NBB22011.1 hypothetical protein [Runella sp. CRIBMP]